MYTLIDFVERGMKCINQLYHYMFKNSLGPVVQTNQKNYIGLCQNISTIHATKLAKSRNGSVGFLEGLM